MANEHLGECHALCFIENRKGISQIFPKIEKFIQFIYFFAKLGITIQLHPFWLKQVIWQNALLEEYHYFIPPKGPGSKGEKITKRRSREAANFISLL